MAANSRDHGGAVRKGRHLHHRIDGPEFRRRLGALADVDQHPFISAAGFLHHPERPEGTRLWRPVDFHHGSLHFME